MTRLRSRGGFSRRDGSALVWAVVILLVLAILVGTVLTLSLSYFTRSLSSNQSKQAYFTARSAASALADQICGSSVGDAGQAILDRLGANGDSVSIDAMQFTSTGGTQSHMGTCKAILTRESYNGHDTIRITATATVGGQSKSVTMRLQYAGGTGGNTGNSTVLKDMVFNGVNNGNGSYAGLQTSSNMDVYISQYQNGVWMGSVDNTSAPQILGNLYSKSALTIDSSQSKATVVKGDIISDQSITFTGYKTTIGVDTSSGSQTSTKIYTTGTVTINNSVVIYSTITAKMVNLNNETIFHNDITADSIVCGSSGYCNTKVYGDMSGNTVSLEDGIAVTGNVTAGTLTMQGNAVVNGNVTANTIVMSDQAKIYGTVTADSLTLKNNALITGDVTARSIAASSQGKIDGSVTAGSMTESNQWMNPVITGNLTVEQAISSYVKVGGTVKPGVAYTASSPTSSPVGPIVSILPDEPSLPTMPELSDHQAEAKAFSSATQLLGNTDGSDSYYVVSKTMSVDKLSTQQSADFKGNIYIYVPSGISLTINDMTKPDLSKTSPYVYIIVESGGKLIRSNKEAEQNWGTKYYKSFYGYILGKEGSTVTIGRGTSIYGGVFSENAVCGYDVTINYWPISGSSSGSSGGSSGSSSGSSSVSSGSASGWSVLQYEEGVTS